MMSSTKSVVETIAKGGSFGIWILTVLFTCASTIAMWTGAREAIPRVWWVCNPDDILQDGEAIFYHRHEGAKKEERPSTVLSPLCSWDAKASCCKDEIDAATSPLWLNGGFHYSCRPTKTKAWNSNVGFKRSKQAYTENYVWRGSKIFETPPYLARMNGMLVVAALCVPLLLGCLRQVCGYEEHIWHRSIYFYSWSWIFNPPKHYSIISREIVPAGKSRKQRKINIARCSLHCVVITCLLCQSYTFAWMCTDIRDNDLDSYPCLEYDNEHSLLNMKCSFAWSNQTECIILLANETFEGNGHSINLTGISNWHGLFRIADSTNVGGPSSFKDAPVVNDVHVIGGSTSDRGGFIIQAEQNHFIVKHCSVSGLIQNVLGGGICGDTCSGDILITHCRSSGEVRGASAGGIAGSEVGYLANEDSTVVISHCYSTGDIVGAWSGGISGWGAGYNSNGGNVIIKQCYSVGEIRGSDSGGIIGGHAANINGHVSITDCYSCGNITGSSFAGGICGSNTGWNGGTVLLTNVYASGQIMHDDAGALIGHIPSNANKISVIMSVYDGRTGDMIGKNDAAGKITEKNNSGDLGDIIGTVYCHNNDEDCWNTDTVWHVVENKFPILQELSAPPSTPTVSSIPTRTSSEPGYTQETKSSQPLNTSSSAPSISPTQRVTDQPTFSNSRTTATTPTPMKLSYAPETRREKSKWVVLPLQCSSQKALLKLQKKPD